MVICLQVNLRKGNDFMTGDIKELLILHGKPLRLELIYINILDKKEINLQIHNRVKKTLKRKLNQKIKYLAISSDYF